MRKIIINGGKKLQGEVTVSGAKNSVVALIPAIILSDGVVTLDGVPAISDVDNLIEIIELMGGSVKRDGETLEIDPRGVKDMPMPFGKISRLRASYYFYGSLIGRYGQATVGLPGGCDLGPRPIDLHLKAFEAMGATISYEAESMRIATEAGQRIRGAHIYMDTVSVGATINTMLAASKAQGRTVIENAAREPEIIDVATLLNNMGAHVRVLVLRLSRLMALIACTVLATKLFQTVSKQVHTLLWQQQLVRELRLKMFFMSISRVSLLSLSQWVFV